MSEPYGSTICFLMPSPPCRSCQSLMDQQYGAGGTSYRSCLSRRRNNRSWHTHCTATSGISSGHWGPHWRWSFLPTRQPAVHGCLCVENWSSYLNDQEEEEQIVSSWILTSHQLHWVTSGQWRRRKWKICGAVTQNTHEKCIFLKMQRNSYFTQPL